MSHFIFKRAQHTVISVFKTETALFSQEDDVIDTGSQNWQAEKTKKGLGSYLRCVSSSDCIL